MKIRPDKNYAARKLVEALRAEVKKLRENNIDEYHAVLMEQAANMIAKDRNIII